MGPDANSDQLMELEKEYHTKVVMKNKYIIGANALTHLYTPDMSEIIFIQVYESLANMEKADEESFVLEKAAWPDSIKRTEFFKKRRKFYTNVHSDELFSSVRFTKQLANPADSNLIILFMKKHLAFPEGGTNKEFRALSQEYFDHVIQKNSSLLGYFPMRHYMGSDGRDFLEVLVFKNMEDMDNVRTSNGKLTREHWPDQAKRREFFQKYNTYFEAWHGDYIYSNIYELHK